MPGIFDPLPAPQFDAYAAARLSWRAGFGGTWREFEKMSAAGLEKSVSALVDLPAKSQAPDEDFAKLPVPPEKEFRESLKEATPEARQLAERNRSQAEERKMRELKLWWLNRMRFEGRPLEEKMTLFWHSHFATAFGDKIHYAFPIWQQNEFFRRNSLRPFPEIFRRVLEDPAMLVWLDNASSHKNHPNENMAREMMELFSLGVGHYSEGDVKAGARALTGYTLNRDEWSFNFNGEMHDFSEKTFLGETGEWDGAGVSRIIWQQAACPRFIAGKLLAFFLYDSPEEDLLAESAKLLREEGTAEFLRTLFQSKLFYSEKAAEKIIKSPVVLAIGALKSMETLLPQDATLIDLLRLMGQDLFVPPDVNGWVEGLAWINSNLLLLRYNFSNYLLNGVSADQFQAFDPKRDGGSAKRRDFVENQRVARGLDWNPREQIEKNGLSRQMLSTGDVVDWLVRQFLARKIPPATRRQFADFLETDASGGRRTFSLNDDKFDERVKGLVHLMMSSPDYQLC